MSRPREVFVPMLVLNCPGERTPLLRPAERGPCQYHLPMQKCDNLIWLLLRFNFFCELTATLTISGMQHSIMDSRHVGADLCPLVLTADDN